MVPKNCVGQTCYANVGSARSKTHRSSPKSLDPASRYLVTATPLHRAPLCGLPNCAEPDFHQCFQGLDKNLLSVCSTLVIFGSVSVACSNDQALTTPR